MHFLSKVGFFDLLYSKFEFPGNSRSREIEIVREIPNPSSCLSYSSCLWCHLPHFYDFMVSWKLKTTVNYFFKASEASFRV